MDIKRGDAEADSYKYYPMEALLTWWETIKKDNHGNYFHDQQKYFLCFIFLYVAF